jgi:transcription elongation factor Elf1
MEQPEIVGVQEGAPKIAQPKCPRCAHLLEFVCNVVRTPPGHLVAVVWCGHCGHTLNTQFLGVDEPQGPRIVRPS